LAWQKNDINHVKAHSVPFLREMPRMRAPMARSFRGSLVLLCSN
jgi:hypothetical protein